MSSGNRSAPFTRPASTHFQDRVAQLRQGAIAAYAAKPRLDVQQRGGQPPLLLVAVAPAIDFARPLLHAAENRFQHVGRR
jgi:hypothetical protein